jgi:hypothetical protein
VGPTSPITEIAVPVAVNEIVAPAEPLLRTEPR